MMQFWLVVSALAAAPGDLPADPVPSFLIQSVDGKSFDMEESLRVKSFVVVAFVGAECPLVRLYAPVLGEIRKDYADKGVEVVAIDANAQDSKDDVERLISDVSLSVPVLLDQDARVADLLGARRTPEVFVLGKDRRILYRGRIDDQHDVAVRGAQATRNDLRIALDELLAGQPVSRPITNATGCLIGRRKEPSRDAGVTYTKDIVSILDRRCIECHRAGEIGPFAMSDYDEVAGWADTILEVVEGGRMPPWFASPDHGTFINDARMTPVEVRTLREWVEQGCPEGDASDLPERREFVDGWNIPTPDVVYPMAKKPFEVPATGEVSYQHYVIDPGFTEDKWIAASEVRPGNHAVVHHVLVYVKDPGKSVFVDGIKGSLLGAYAPGSPGRALRPGSARRVPAGAKLILQVHYTTTGKPEKDLSVLGLKFCDPSEVTEVIESGWATNFFLAIPPRAANHTVKAFFTFPEDRELHQLTPHMHLRGKSFKYIAHYPDGSQEILLDVPRFDFGWQIDYVLTTPKPMPKGSRLECVAVYDNSEGNRSNPDPNRTVTFGEQTWDEMMIGWFISGKPNSIEKPVALNEGR